jgi:predicted PolB exonuclease-like 3'-5' exonuclease
LFKSLSPRQAAQEEPYRQSSLSWSFGRIVCIGLLVERENQQMEEQAFLARIDPQDTPAESLAKEADALKAFWEFVLPDDYFIGHNILNFDLPFLWNRSLVCGVRPSRPFYLYRESVRFTFDTMQVWAHWSGSPGSRQFVKLGTLTQLLGLRGKTGAGSQVYDLWCEARFEEIRDYCLSDVRLEYDLYRRLTLAGSAPTLRWNQCEDDDRRPY